MKQNGSSRFTEQSEPLSPPPEYRYSACYQFAERPPLASWGMKRKRTHTIRGRDWHRGKLCLFRGWRGNLVFYQAAIKISGVGVNSPKFVRSRYLMRIKYTPHSTADAEGLKKEIWQIEGSVYNLNESPAIYLYILRWSLFFITQREHAINFQE